MNTTAFYIIIATAGRNSLLSRTLQSLSECEIPSNLKHTIIIENGLKYEAETIANSFSGRLNIKYMYSSEPNKSNALNIALASINEDALVFFTDDDIRFERYFLKYYAQAAKEGNSNNFYYGGPVGVDYEREPPEWLKAFLPPSTVPWKVETIPGENLQYFLGCNYAAFTSAIKRLGGFNVQLGPGAKTGATGQENEMQRRLYHNGFRAKYLEEAIVYHYVPRERCSISWALHRKYRRGLNNGLREERYDAAFDLFSYPFVLLKSLFKAFLLTILSLFRWKKHEGMKWAVKVSYTVGVLRGIKKRKKQQIKI